MDRLAKTDAKKMSLKLFILWAKRMDDGSRFHASGPAYENDHSPNFVLSRGLM